MKTLAIYFVYIKYRIYKNDIVNKIHKKCVINNIYIFFDKK